VHVAEMGKDTLMSLKGENLNRCDRPCWRYDLGL